MFGLGSIVNALAIAAGGLIGLLIGRRLSPSLQQAVLQVNGLCVLFIGMSGALALMESSDSTLMMILCFCAGTLLGEWINIERLLGDFGSWLKKVSSSENDTGFIHGFITASLTVCIGAMAIVGGIQDGLGNPEILYTKALLDFVIVLVMAGSMGKGVIFSAVPVFLLQFGVACLAVWISPWMSDAMLANISLTGNMMVFCVGINLLWPGKFKVANMLPTLLFAALAACL